MAEAPAGQGAGGGAAGEAPLRGFVIGDSDVHDQEAYLAGVALGMTSVAQHGGTVLWAGGRFEHLEGSHAWHRLVGLVFPGVAEALAWHDSPEYAPSKAHRLASARSKIVVLEQTGALAAVAAGPAAPGGPPRAYMVGDVTEMHDWERFKEYLRGVGPSLAEIGARYLSRGGRVQAIGDGEWQPTRMVLIEFPSYEAAAAWYRSDAYQPLARLRQSCSETDLVLVEGVSSS